MNVHIVQKGDTLWKIARQNGVSFDELKRMNAHLANPDYIVPGMKIFLPDKAAGKKLEMVHPFNDGRPPKTVVVSEKEKVVEMPVVELPKEEVVEEVYETPPMPIPQVQPIQMPHYHSIQYVPITKNFYSVQQHAQVQPPAPKPAYVQPVAPMPVPMPDESPLVEEIVEEQMEPMQMPPMAQPFFTGPICGCMPMPEFCPPLPCNPCTPPMHHMYPMGMMPMPYYGSPGEWAGMPNAMANPGMPGMMYNQAMPSMMYNQAVPQQPIAGMMPNEMVQGVMDEDNYGPEPLLSEYPADYQTQTTDAVGGQMTVNPGPSGWLLESSSDEPSSFLEKFEQQYQQGAPGQVAGAFAPQSPAMFPDYYGFQQPGFQQPNFQYGYPMDMAPYNYNPYMMPGQYGFGAGPCNCC